VLIIERAREMGGILLQCIHQGFGTHIFKEDLAGPTYAQRFVEKALALGVDTLLDTMVLDVTPDRHIRATSQKTGVIELHARALVLAMGCRERTRAQVQLPGTRPAGVYTAGTAQRFVNVEGYMPGKRFVILGSGDIGMIMARRLTFEGAKVERMLEIMPFLSGLMRNYVQCLQDFDIPLDLQHTVNRIIGNRRVEAIESVRVDENWAPVPGSEEIIECDTLLLSVGLIPENELSRRAGVRLDPITGGPTVDESFQTNVPGIFAAGNVVHVYDLVDWVTEAGSLAGQRAAEFATAPPQTSENVVQVEAGDNVRYIVPQVLHVERVAQENIRLQMRVRKPIEQPVWVEVWNQDELVTRKVERYVRPGEMVTVVLPTRAYEALRGADVLTVKIVER